MPSDLNLLCQWSPQKQTAFRRVFFIGFVYWVVLLRRWGEIRDTYLKKKKKKKERKGKGGSDKLGVGALTDTYYCI